MRRLLIATVALGLAGLPSPRAAAYCLQTFQIVEGYSTWNQAQVPYHVSANLTDPAMLAAIDAAFQTWNQVPCSKLKFTKAASFDPATVQFKDHDYGVYVYWHTEEATYPTQPRFVTYAYLSVEADAEGAGEIVGASVAINAFSAKWDTNGDLDSFDLQAELTERIGQVIGLETSNAIYTVMKQYFKNADLDKRTLKTDDLNGLTFLYGDGTCTNPPPQPGPDGCAAPPPGDGQPLDGGVIQPGLDAGGRQDVGGIDLNKVQCTNNTQCPIGQVCSFEGFCVPDPNAGNNPGDGGCDCSTSSTGNAAGLGGLLAGLLLLVLVRRR